MDATPLMDAMPPGDFNYGDPLRTASILTYELGDLIKCLVYLQVRGKEGYKSEAKLAHADLVTMARLIAEQEGWHWQEQVSLGEQRYLERMEEVKGWLAKKLIKEEK